ncbi:hypothetical protein BH10CYA1_BH10CYA1_41300 [soil metagenome]
MVLRFFVNMALRKKLLISFGLIIFFLCLIVWTAFATILEVNKIHHAIYEKDLPVALDLMTLSENIKRMRLAGQLLLLVDDSTVEDKQMQELAEIEIENKAIINKLQSRFQREPETQLLLSKVDQSLKSFYHGGTLSLNPRTLASKSDEEKVKLLKVQRQRFRQMVTQSEELRNLPILLAEEHLKQSEESENRSLTFFAALGIAAIGCSVLLVATLTRLIAEPVHSLTLAAKRIEDGDLLVQLRPDDRADEFGVLNRAFLRMSSSLVERSLELEKSIKEVKESNAQLKHFAYIAAHDLKEPLRTITSYLELLTKRQEGKLDEKSERYIKNTISGATRMGELIDALLLYARLDSRAEPFADTDCEEVVDQVIRDLKVLLQEKQANVTYDSLPVVHADKRQVTQIFQNLIQNAIKFQGSDSPEVHISATRQESDWLFSVKDNGIGMEMQFVDRIFAIFQRLHTRDEYPGTGMGLSICKKIVERHGGEIRVESEPDKGSNFLFTIKDA